MSPIVAMLGGAVPAIGWSDAGPVVGSGSHAFEFASWGALEWISYSAMALVCIWILWRAVVTTVRPNEDAPDHVKRMILDGDALPPRLLRAAPLPPPPPIRH